MRARSRRSLKSSHTGRRWADQISPHNVSPITWDRLPWKTAKIRLAAAATATRGLNSERRSMISAVLVKWRRSSD